MAIDPFMTGEYHLANSECYISYAQRLSTIAACLLDCQLVFKA